MKDLSNRLTGITLVVLTTCIGSIVASAAILAVVALWRLILR